MTTDTSAEALEQLAKGMGFEDQVAHYDAMIDAILALAAEKRRAREGITNVIVNDAIDAYVASAVEHGWDAEQVEHVMRAEDMRAALEAVLQDGRDAFDFAAHLQRQRDWSGKTFGPGSRAQGVVDHIRKELKEIEADPGDLKEWIDVVILALDGAWRSGASPQEIIGALVAKQTKNENRVWPDWRTADPNKAIEHDRSCDAAMQDTDHD